MFCRDCEGTEQLRFVSIFVIGCILLNFGGKMLAQCLQLPLWLDSLGTALAAYALDPVCGAGTMFNYIYFDGTIGNVWGDGIREFFCQLGWKPLLSHMIGEFYMEFVDKVVTLFAVYVIVKLWKRLRENRRKRRKRNTRQAAAHLVALLVVCSLVCACEPV